MTKEDIQKVLELALEYYKLEVFGTGKESENPSRERIDWIYDRMKEEQGNCPKLSDNLEDAAEEYATTHIRNNEFPTADSAFIAGAEWQYQKDRGEFAKIKAKTWSEGFDDCKEQMMKDAVEGTVHNFSSNVPHPTVLVDAKGFNQGDKVRVIIVKEK